MISIEDYLTYVDDALDAMTAIVVELGDERANLRLDVPAANSPYAVLTHCLGVMEFWGGEMVAGRQIERDRAAEFRAFGPVAELVERVGIARAQLSADLAQVEPEAPPRGTPDPQDALLPVGRSQGGVLMHVYEELAQHLGQLQVTRDVLLAGSADRH